ncbi:MAG: radical SAM protein [Bacteroidales bacterium]|nr:radical SAM protein [Bacteroidales bacterium]
MGISDSIKTILHNWHKKKEAENHPLNYLFLEITRRCNLNCLHCGSDCKSETGLSELTTDSWLKIIDFVYENISEKITFVITGGEPLLHKDLFKIGNHIKSKGMNWAMVTNGILLNSERMTNLELAGISALTISVDGLEYSHNKLRNSPIAYNKLLVALDALGNSSIKFKDAVTCVYPDNLNQLNEIGNLLVEKKMESWRLFRIFPSGRAENNNKLLLSFEQTSQMVNWIKVNKPRFKEKGLNINLSCEGWLPYNTDKKVRDLPFFCRAGINIASILADGTITGCTNNHPSFYEGNILEDNLANLWQNGFEKFRKREWLKNTDCAGCKHVKSCNGGSIHLWNLERKSPGFCYVIPE